MVQFCYLTDYISEFKLFPVVRCNQGWKRNHESLYFGLGIMNNETLRKAQQNTRMIKLRSIQGMQDMAFPRDQFSKNFPGKHAPASPI